MAVTLTHRDGRMIGHVDDADLDSLLAELDDPEDAEHPDVSVAHESGWALSAFPNGLVILENLDGDELGRHRASLTRDEIRGLFMLLSMRT